MKIQEAINHFINGESLSSEQMQAVMREVMTGNASDAQIGGFLIALRMKGETSAEILGAAQVMRELATKVEVDSSALIDTVGTGGDSAGLFNVSTASAFIVAAAGGKVAKHGNRSVTSNSGSADLLEEAGVRLDLSAEEVARCVNEVGVGFMFAVNHHSAMKHAIGPRKQLAARTIFNLLGPLTNPANALHQVIGVFEPQWLPVFAEVLQQFGSKHVLCVSSADGLDEISIADTSFVTELKNGDITSYEITPTEFGLPTHTLDSLKVATPEESLRLIKAALSGEHSAAADMLAFNAGAAIYAGDLCSNLQQGVDMAQDAIGSGLALQKLQELADFTTLLKAN
ncbi:MAG: anthranilate phosphoribosyltransferase [Pseudomonadales bacterium]